MDLKHLKPKLGKWLAIDELRDQLATMPETVCNSIPVNRKLLETAAEFVEVRRGWWEHADWEAFLQELHAKGFNLSEEHKAPIGNILEIFKKYYRSDTYKEVAEKRRRSNARVSHS
ncbi:MAG: hypothetical protein AB1640_24690 [bacterium]